MIAVIHTFGQNIELDSFYICNLGNQTAAYSCFEKPAIGDDGRKRRIFFQPKGATFQLKQLLNLDFCKPTAVSIPRRRFATLG